MWRDISTAARPAQQFLSQMGIVRVLSAFEDFTVRVEAEHDRALSLMSPTAKHKRAASGIAADAENKLIQLCRRLGWDISSIDAYLPLLDFFYLARNCIVHRSGRASEALVSMSASPELAHSHANFPTRTGTKLPKFPSIGIDRELNGCRDMRCWHPRYVTE